MHEAIESIHLRLYEKSPGKGREAIEKIACSLGLIQTNDSRDTIIDVLHIMLKASKTKTWLSSKDIGKLTNNTRQENNLKVTADSNIRRILKFLQDQKIVEKEKAKYRIIGFDYARMLEEKRKTSEKILQRIEEYCRTV